MKLSKNTNISVVGLGYVGLQLSIALSKKYSTTGFDINKARINELNIGEDKSLEVSKEKLRNAKEIIFTHDLKSIANCSVYIITVPTPVDNNNKPDMGPLISASEMIGKLISSGDIIIYESTVYPGATEEICVPILEECSNLKYNVDFSCGYSPERINPGDKKNTLTKIKKVTSGSNKKTADFVDELYKSIIPEGTFRASSISVAETAKVIENVQRDVNIGLINEISMITDKLDISIYDVLDAANTKWNFLNFEPGLVGGHCIGVDPYYLSYKAKEIGFTPNLLLSGREINESMSSFLVDLIIKETEKKSMQLEESKVGIFGVTYKENCSDLRNSKVFDVIKKLDLLVDDLVVTDELANSADVKKICGKKLVSFDNVNNLDLIFLAVPHQQYLSINKDNWVKKLNKGGIIFDYRGKFRKIDFHKSKINYCTL